MNAHIDILNFSSVLYLTSKCVREREREREKEKEIEVIDSSDIVYNPTLETIEKRNFFPKDFELYRIIHFPFTHIVYTRLFFKNKINHGLEKLEEDWNERS